MDRVIFVVTSWGHRRVPEVVRGAALASGGRAAPLTRTENSIGVSCGATLTNETVSLPAVLAFVEDDSIVTPAPALEASRAIAAPSFFAPTASSRGVRDGPI